jgi:hypothetical protein
MNLARCSYSLLIPVTMLLRLMFTGARLLAVQFRISLAGWMFFSCGCLVGSRQPPVTSWSLVRKCPTTCACLIVC